MIDLEALIKAVYRKELIKAHRMVQGSKITTEKALRCVLEKAMRDSKTESFEKFVQSRIDTLNAQRQTIKQCRQVKKVKTQAWSGWFDGAANPTNPGPRGIGALIVIPGGQRIEISRSIGFGSSNEAEYQALIALLEVAVERGCKHLIVRGDSQLVVNQVNGDWNVKTHELLVLHKKASQLVRSIGNVDLKWIPREQNREADRLSKATLGNLAEPSGPRDNDPWSGSVFPM
jgi:ribonuclease HI